MATSDDKNILPPKAGLTSDRPDQPERSASTADTTPPGSHGFKPKLVVIPPAVKARPAPTPPKLHLEHKNPTPTQQTPVEKPRLLVLPTLPPPPPNVSVEKLPSSPPAQPLPPSSHESRPATPPLRLIPLAELQQKHTQLGAPGGPPAAGTSRGTVQPGRRRKRMDAPRSRRRWLLVFPVAAVVAAFLGWWALDRSRVRSVPTPPAVLSATPAGFPASPSLVSHPVRPVPTGGLRLRAFALTADGARHAITNEATFALRHMRTPLTLTTNATLPFVWQNLTADAYVLSVTAPGYRPIVDMDVTVAIQEDAAVSLDLHPLPTNVRFMPSASDVTFAVYQDGRYLGSSKETFALDPFVPHILTFKASGWREETVKVTLASPGITYRCRVAMARIATGMELTVVSDTGNVPKTGLLSVNDSDPVLVTLPLKRTALSYTGEIKISLTVAGYTVVNNAQQVLLADGKITQVVFRVEPSE